MGSEAEGKRSQGEARDEAEQAEQHDTTSEGAGRVRVYKRRHGETTGEEDDTATVQVELLERRAGPPLGSRGFNRTSNSPS